MNKQRVLILSSDDNFARSSFEYLAKYDFDIDLRTNVNQIEMIETISYDAIIFDCGASAEDGIASCCSYRQMNGNAAFIIAVDSMTLDDKVRALDLGADEVFLKPLLSTQHPVFTARLHALLRRPRTETPDGKLRLDSLILDQGKRTLSMNGRKTLLSVKECELLGQLMSSPDNVFSSTQLAQKNEESKSRSDDSIRQRIRIVRRKLASIGAADLIKTVANSGYVLASIG